MTNSQEAQACIERLREIHLEENAVQARLRSLKIRMGYPTDEQIARAALAGKTITRGCIDL